MKKTLKIILGLLLLLVLITLAIFTCDPETEIGEDQETETGKGTGTLLPPAGMIPNQYVLSFEDSVMEGGVMVPLDEATIDSLIQLFTSQGDTILDSCMCDRMVLIAPAGPVTPQERQQEAQARLDPQGDGSNKYGISSLNFTLQIRPVTDSVQINYEFDFKHIEYRPNLGSMTAKVAILDTGFNPSFGALGANIWTNPDEVLDAIDNDKNCIKNDINGADISTHESEFSYTDGHGMAVAGKVMGAFGEDYPSDINLQMMNIKFTHNDPATDRQIGNLFDAVCGMRYAISKDASVITASFGLYQDSVSSLLEDVVLNANKHNVTIIAAAGNDTTNIDSFPFYPASFASMSGFENVISVGAVDASNKLAVFSNYGKESVLLVAPGVNQHILSPFGGNITMDGTSIAVPIVARTASIIKAHTPDISPAKLRTCLLNGALDVPPLLTKINKGVFNPKEALESCGISIGLPN